MSFSDKNSNDMLGYKRDIVKENLVEVVNDSDCKIKELNKNNDTENKSMNLEKIEDKLDCKQGLKAEHEVCNLKNNDSMSIGIDNVHIIKNKNENTEKQEETDYDRMLINKFLNFKEKFICFVCSKDISNSIRIITHKTLRIACINCLLSEHVLEDYHVVDKLDFSIFSKNWSAKEEFKLLFGVEKFGLDNWNEISSYIKSKPKIPCESHYYNYYLKNSENPLPNKDEIALMNCINNNYVYDELKLVENDKKEENLRKIVIENKGSIPDLSSSNKDNLLNANRSRSLVKNRNRRDQKNITTAEEIIGYWPKRKEFDVEYLNEAELEISDLEFYEDDTKEERELKLNVLHVYNIHLDERDFRKE